MTGEPAGSDALRVGNLTYRDRVIAFLLAKYPNAYWDKEVRSIQHQIDADGILLERLAREKRAKHSIRIWQNHDCLVVPRTWRRKTKFEWAQKRCPLPVASRVSGGGAVVHGPHILNISVGQRLENCDIGALYRPIYECLLPVFLELGMDADIGPVSGAHCDGRFNIRSSGKKIAGTAAFSRSFADHHYAVTHASVAILESGYDLPTITAFETGLGLAPVYSANAHTSLEAELAIKPDVTGRITSAKARSHIW